MSRENVTRLRRDLRASTSDGVAYSVMVGAGEVYIPAFALAVGAGEVAAGLIASVPLLAGATLQLAAPWAIRRIGIKRWVVAAAATQACSFVPLLVGAIAGTLPGMLLFAAVILYWGAGYSTGPAWNAWIETLVPRAVRPGYFARRNRLCHAAVVAGLILGGLVLEQAKVQGATLAGFAAVFAIAAISRGVSSWSLSRQSGGAWSLSVPGPPEAGRALPSGGRSLLGYMIALQVAVYVAAPFFTPYMLVELKLSYAGFTTLTATALLARVLVMPALGRLARRYGAKLLLVGGGLGIVPLSGLWSLHDGFGYLLALQLLSGVSWAAYELGTLLLLFETIPLRHRVSVLTLFNFGHACALVVGTCGGAFLLEHLGADRSAYLVVFLASTAARALAACLLRRIPAVATRSEMVGTRTIAVRPSAGSIERPVLPSLRESPPADERGLAVERKPTR